MNDSTKEKPGWKQRIVREFIRYWINVFYLMFFLGTFTWYRRLILAEYKITYLEYGISIVEALILAKVILVGEALHLGRRLEGKPLVIPTLYKTVVFSLLVGVFAIVEYLIGGWWNGKGLTGGVDEIVTAGKKELFARCVRTFFALLPFFAFKEIEQVLGEGKLRALFFCRRSTKD